MRTDRTSPWYRSALVPRRSRASRAEGERLPCQALASMASLERRNHNRWSRPVAPRAQLMFFRSTGMPFGAERAKLGLRLKWDPAPRAQLWDRPRAALSRAAFLVLDGGIRGPEVLAEASGRHRQRAESRE